MSHPTVHQGESENSSSGKQYGHPRRDTPLGRTPSGLALGEPIITLKNIQKTYLIGLEGVPALRGINLTIHRGEWLVIYGTSGGGKTSLLNVIGTVDKPTRGELRMWGELVNDRTRDEVLANVRLNKLGFVFQAFNLLSAMSARENVQLPMMLSASRTAAEHKLAAKRNLEKVGLGHRLGHFPKQLSGGEQQRVTIARAISNEPEVLLLDEPTGDLDTMNSNRVIDLLRQLNEERGITLIMVTHDVYLKSFAHRVIFMRDGKIASEEAIPQQVREEAFRELDEKLALQEEESTIEVKTHVTGGGSRGPDREGGKEGKRMTEIRRPEDYATIAFGRSADQIPSQVDDILRTSPMTG